jgi:hypothetical protein
MDARVENPNDTSVGELFHKLLDEGREMAGAEARLYKEIALYRAGKAKGGLAALGAAIFLVNAGLVAAMVGFVIGLAPYIGPVASGLAVLAASAMVGFLLFRYGAGKLRALSGDAEEKAALTAGELVG